MMKLVLKEAFRLQNYLSSLLESAESTFNSSDFTTRVEQHHYKSRAVSGAEDETVVFENEAGLPYGPQELIDFMCFVVDTKERLTAAISKAKFAMTGFDIDGELTNNSVRREVSRLLKLLGTARPKKSKNRGSSYTFNNEGNQVSYYYDMEVESTPRYDTNAASRLAKELASKADAISTEVDRAMVEIEVDFETDFDVNESFEDAVMKFIKAAK